MYIITVTCKINLDVLRKIRIISAAEIFLLLIQLMLLTAVINPFPINPTTTSIATIHIEMMRTGGNILLLWSPLPDYLVKLCKR